MPSLSGCPRAADSANELRSKAHHTTRNQSSSGRTEVSLAAVSQNGGADGICIAARCGGGGSSRTGERSCVKSAGCSSCVEKRSMTGAMFQAQGHSAAPARALQKTLSVAAARPR